MLQSFIGTFDAVGLRSLRTEDESSAKQCDETVESFWAILDPTDLSTIHEALLCGRRGTALELLIRQAKSLGRLCG